jgi:DNA-binding PadR family transcriptional regulator
MTPLGEFETIVLLAVLQLDKQASGSAIRADIAKRSGRAVPRGSLYVTLDRLEDKGLLLSRLGDATTARGGRPRRFFRVTAAGMKAVRESVGVLSRMHRGLEPLLGGF